MEDHKRVQHQYCFCSKVKQEIFTISLELWTTLDASRCYHNLSYLYHTLFLYLLLSMPSYRDACLARKNHSSFLDDYYQHKCTIDMLSQSCFKVLNSMDKEKSFLSNCQSKFNLCGKYYRNKILNASNKCRRVHIYDCLEKRSRAKQIKPKVSLIEYSQISFIINMMSISYSPS